MTDKDIAAELERVAKEMRGDGYHDGNEWLETIEACVNALQRR